VEIPWATPKQRKLRSVAGLQLGRDQLRITIVLFRFASDSVSLFLLTDFVVVLTYEIMLFILCF
jgi:hypothetical protein